MASAIEWAEQQLSAVAPGWSPDPELARARALVERGVIAEGVDAETVANTLAHAVDAGVGDNGAALRRQRAVALVEAELLAPVPDGPQPEPTRLGPPPAVWAHRTVHGGVRLEMTRAALGPVLDQVAEAYADDPDYVAGLLAELGGRLRALRSAQQRGRYQDASDWEVGSAGGAVDEARDALETAVSGEDIVHDLSPRDANRLAAELTAAAQPFRGAYNAGGAA